MSSTTLAQTTPTARKPHRCDWCGEMILKGEKYSRWTGVYEGDFVSSVMHVECQDAYFKAWSEDDEGYEYHWQMRGTTCERGCTCGKHAQRAKEE